MTGKQMRRHDGSGFTLIELMITVAIVAILAAIAYPSYIQHLRKGARAEGKTAMMRTAQLLERYYTANGGYPAAIGTAYGGTLAGLTSITSAENPTAVTGKYDITMATADPNPPPVPPNPQTYNSYTLTATPRAPFQDPDCGILTLTSTGARGYSVATGTTQLCW
jgi:type IV pilus assembly protein PilE